MINKIMCTDALRGLKELLDNSVNCCVTSPPYFHLRDYEVEGQIGLEDTPEEFVDSLVKVFHEVKRVLKPDGTLWIVIGDSYNASNKGNSPKKLGKKALFQKEINTKIFGHPTKVKGLKPKDLIGIPWMLAFALRADGWYLRQDIIWNKGANVMPESVQDRCTKAHEYIFLLSKSRKYYFDHKAIAEPTVTRDNTVRDRDVSKLNNTPGRTRMGGLTTNNYETRNKRDVWNVPIKPFKGAHFATYPEDLIIDCIRAGCPHDGIVLDPFMGAGTTAVVARKLGRNYVGIELNPASVNLANKRLDEQLGFFR